MGLSEIKGRRTFRLGPKYYLGTAANGHLMISWPDAGHDFFTLLCSWFRLRYNLGRAGHSVYSPHETILPDLVGTGFRLNSGWDNWSGYYLLSEEDAGDQFLRRFAGIEE